MLHGPVLRVFRRPRYLFLALLISTVVFLAYAAIPFNIGDEVDLRMFIGTTPPIELLAFVVISLLSGIVFTLHISAHLAKTLDASHTGIGMMGVFSGLLSAILGGVTCAPCISIFLSVLGVAGTAFIAAHRFEASLLAIALLCLSLHLTAKRMSGTCIGCRP